MTFDEIVEFVEPEFAQLHDGSFSAIDERQDITGLVLAVHLHNNPCLVYTVTTTEIGVRQNANRSPEALCWRGRTKSLPTRVEPR